MASLIAKTKTMTRNDHKILCINKLLNKNYSPRHFKDLKGELFFDKIAQPYRSLTALFRISPIQNPQ